MKKKIDIITLIMILSHIFLILKFYLNNNTPHYQLKFWTVMTMSIVLQCVAAHASSSHILHRERRNWIIESFEIDEGYKGPFPYSLGLVSIYEGFYKYECDITLWQKQKYCGCMSIPYRLKLNRTSRFSKYTVRVLTRSRKVCYR